MTDNPPGFTERRQYKRYALELVLNNQAALDDLEYLRTSEEGARVSIMPIGAREISQSMKFIVQHKSFHEVNYATGEIDKKPIPDVTGLIEYVKKAPSSPTVINQSAAAGEKRQALFDLSDSKVKSSTGGAMYQISPTVTGKGALIPDKYKIKPRSDTDGK